MYMCSLCLNPYLDLYRCVVAVDKHVSMWISIYIYIYIKFERCICMFPSRERESSLICDSDM